VRRGEVVQNDEEEVEAGEQRVGQTHVLLRGRVLVVLPVDRVGRRHHGAARVERGVDPGLGDGHRLPAPSQGFVLELEFVLGLPSTCSLANSSND